MGEDAGGDQDYSGAYEYYQENAAYNYVSEVAEQRHQSPDSAIYEGLSSDNPQDKELVFQLSREYENWSRDQRDGFQELVRNYHLANGGNRLAEPI